MTTILPEQHLKSNHIYDPYQIPPDWQLAQHHGKATLPGRLISQQSEICPCCLNYIDKKEIPIWEDNKQLAFLGQGFPLFFNFIKFCMIMLAIVILDSCAANVLLNRQQNKCIHHQTPARRLEFTQCVDNVYNNLANITATQTSGIRILLKVVSFIAQIFVLLYFRQQQSTLANYLDERNTTPSDYTFQMFNIPLGLKNYKQKITEFIKQLDASLKIEDILIIQDMKQHYVLQKRLQKIIEDKKNEAKRDASEQMMKKYDEDYKRVEQQLVDLGHFMEKKQELYFLGTAYIIMNTEEQKYKAIELTNKATPQIILKHFPIYNAKEGKLEANQSNQPKEINWENIHYTYKQRVAAIIIGWLLFIFILAIIFVIFFFVIKFKSQIIEHAELNAINDPTHLDQYQKQIKGGIALGYILVVLINIINKFGLSHIAHHITDHEKHIHYSDLQYSFALKYMLSMFFTTALMTLLVEAILFGNYSKTLGVVQEESFMFIFNAIFSPLMWLINPYYLANYIKRKLHYGEQYMTQKQANRLMEFPKYDMGKRYAEIMKTMWFTFLYIELLPAGSIFSLIGLVLYYVIDKYILLRRSCVKESISSDLSKAMIKILQFTLVLKPIGQLVFAYQIRRQFLIPSLIMICIGIVYMLLPLEKILQLFFKEQFIPEVKTYAQAKHKFVENYFTCYPLRKHQTHLKHISLKSKAFKPQISISRPQVFETQESIIKPLKNKEGIQSLSPLKKMKGGLIETTL